MTPKEVRKKIINKEIDINNSDLFFGDAIKGAILFLNDNIKLRDKRVPHFILNTGDSILYKELLGYEYDAVNITDENFIYNEIPRCIINVNDVSLLPDQLTQPYVRSCFEIEHDDCIYEFSAETRRMPVHMTISLKYYIDSMTDALALSQYLVTTLSFIRTYSFSYMGNEVLCSLKFPEAYSTEKPSEITFDSETRYKNIGIDLELETNIPIFDERTAIETNAIIRQVDNTIGKKSISHYDDSLKKKTYVRDSHEDLFRFHENQLYNDYKVYIKNDIKPGESESSQRLYKLINEKLLFDLSKSIEEREAAWKDITSEN